MEAPHDIRANTDKDPKLRPESIPKVCPQKRKAKKLSSHAEKHICNYFKGVCSAGCETSTLKCHLDDFSESTNKTMEKRPTTLGSQIKDDGPSTSVHWKFDEDLYRDALARMIIIDGLPLRLVIHDSFHTFVSGLQPRYKSISLRTVVRDIVQIHTTEKKKLKAFLSESAGRVSVTTNSWTSLQDITYMCITVHFIDKNWKLQKIMIGFVAMDGYMGEDIGKLVESYLFDWGITQVTCLTADNATTNDLAMSNLIKQLVKKNSLILSGKYFHVRCTAHVLNLVVKNELDEMSISLDRIRDVVDYCRSSPSCAKQFKSAVGKEGIDCNNSLYLDDPTRWNSTYLMLVSALKFQTAFDRMKEEDPELETNLSEGAPTEDDWNKAHAFSKILKWFYNAANRISPTSDVSANLFFHEICTVEIMLNDWCKNEDIYLSSMALRMKQNFDSYWGEYGDLNMLLTVAIILDPRYKMKYVKFCFEKLHSPQKAVELSNNALEVFQETFNYYDTHFMTSISTKWKEGGEDDVFHVIDDNVIDIDAEFEKIKNEESCLVKKSELDKYLEKSLQKQDPNFDLLAWWSSNETTYPVLALMAKDVLAIQVSSVASDSAFIIGGCVLHEYRESLTPRLVECLICTQDWLRDKTISSQTEEIYDVLEDIESLANTDATSEDASSK